MGEVGEAGEKVSWSHLDDGALNAVLDGEADAEEAAHARSCAPCGARLERFARVARAVGTPVEPVGDERRARAVAEAVRVAGSVATVAAPAGKDVVERRDRRPERAGRRPEPNRPIRWALAAAGVALLAVAVPLLDRALETRASRDLAGSAEGSTEGSSADRRSPVAAGQAPLDGGDLGDLGVADVAALARRLDLAADEPSARDRLAPAPAPQAALPEAGPAAATTGDPTVPCEAAARARDPGLGRLAYRARARLDGVEAVVLGFAASGEATTGEVLALAAGTCAELASAPS